MPLGLLYPTFAKNYPGLIYDVADGTATDSHFEPGTFLGGAEVESDNAKSSWLPLTVGKNTRLMRYMMQDGQAFSIPGGEATVAMVCAQGKSMEDVEKEIKNEAEHLNIFFSKCSVDYLDKVRKDYIEPLKKLGYDFDALTKTSPSERPSPVFNPTKTSQDGPQQTKTALEDISPTHNGSDPISEAIAIANEAPVDLPNPKLKPHTVTGSSTFVTPVDGLGIPLDM